MRGHVNVKNVEYVQVLPISPLITWCLGIGIIASSSYLPFLKKNYEITTSCIFSDIPLAKLHFIVRL